MFTCASCAWAAVATLPVPIAHTGSYAITTFLIAPTRVSSPLSMQRGEDGYARPVGLLERGDDGGELPVDDLRRPVRLALGERLADAEDHGEPRVERGARLLRDELGGLAEDRAALGVACVYAGECKEKRESMWTYRG